MKRTVLMIAVALVVVASTYAQNKLVAILSHGNDLTTFYGTSALINAVEAAESGDVITLSEGTFAFADMTKAITIRGGGAEKTIIGRGTSTTNYRISIPESDANTFCVEGVTINTYNTNSGYTVNIYGQSSKLYFLKCIISTGLSFMSTSSVNATFVDSKITGFALNGSSSVRLSNSFVSGFSNVSETTSKADFFNCLLFGDYTNGFGKYYRSSFVNCILYYNYYYGAPSFPAETSAMNSLAINANFNGINAAVDCTSFSGTSAVKSIFTSYDVTTNQYGNEKYLPTTYELTDEAKATYLGTDGKEVGLYGGQYPYNLTPSYPLITKMNVAKQATADNKLSVEIEVSAVE